MHPRNAKLFQRIKHPVSDSVKCKQTKIDTKCVKFPRRNGLAVSYRSNGKLGGFRSQLEMCNLTEELGYNETVSLSLSIYIYIYIYIYI